MDRVGQALMYASGGVFATFSGFIIVALANYYLANDLSWLITALVITVLYWWIFPILAIMAFIGWYMGRGTSRGASLAMVVGGGLFTFTIFYLIAMSGFWEPLLTAAALLYVPSIVTLALGIHSYVAPPVEVRGGRGRIGMAIYHILEERRPRRALREVGEGVSFAGAVADSSEYDWARPRRALRRAR
jgi:hypothetical protein